MLLTFLLIFVEPFLGYAANNSISAGSSKTADIDTAGNLKFSVKAVGASSGTRWKTVGLYVTSDPTGRNGKEGTKAKDCVFFDKLPKGCSKKDETDRTGMVTTSFTISKEVFNSMCDKAGVNLKTLQKNGGKVYIQGVLQGYSIRKGGSKRNVTERCYTYKQMANTRNTRKVNGSTWYGIGWPASCNEGWRARYDIAVEYKKVEAPVTINYYQSYEGKWKLVLSVTNSDDGKIEKNPVTRNLNKANTGYQWSSTSGSGSIASGDRGLGLEKKYYISLSEINCTEKLFYNVLKLFSKEDRDDCRRCFVCSKSVVISRIGSRFTKQICVYINCFQDTCQYQKELYIFVRRLARIHHVDAVVARQGPVVVLTGTIDSVKWFLMQQTGQTVMSCDTLHRLHDHLVVIDCQIDLTIGWR